MEILKQYASTIGIISIIVGCIISVIVSLTTDESEILLLSPKKRANILLTKFLSLTFFYSVICFFITLFKDEPKNFDFRFAIVISVVTSLVSSFLAFLLLNFFVSFIKKYYYFVVDEDGKEFYIIKTTYENKVILADSYRIKNSTFLIFKDKNFLKDKRIFQKDLSYRGRRKLSNQSSITENPR